MLKSGGNDNINTTSFANEIMTTSEISGSIDFNVYETKTIEIDGVNYEITSNNSTPASISYVKNTQTNEMTFSCNHFTIKGESDVKHNFIINGTYNNIYGGNLADHFSMYNNLSQNNKFYGLDGEDTFNLTAVGTIAYGGDGNDIFNATSGYNDLYGDNGNDKFYINAGQIEAYGGEGNDYIEHNHATGGIYHGEGGEDEFNIVSGSGNTVDGGNGTNKLTDNGTGTVAINVPGASSFNVNFAKNEQKVLTIDGKKYTVLNRNTTTSEFIYSIEKGQIIFNSKNFTIIAQKNVAHNVNLKGEKLYYYGSDKGDTIIANSGEVFAGSGNDNIKLYNLSTCYAGDGDDYIENVGTYNKIMGQKGNDTLVQSGGMMYGYVDMGEDDDIIKTNNKYITGTTVLGGEGDDTFEKGSSNIQDSFLGVLPGYEDITYLKLNPKEEKTIQINGINYQIQSKTDQETSIAYKYDPIENKICFTGASVYITGQNDVAHNVEVYGSNIRFTGGEKNDTITFVSGYSATMIGQEGNDILTTLEYGRGCGLYGQKGDDTLHINAAAGSHYGGEGNDTFYIADGAYNIDGSDGDDIFYVNCSSSSIDNLGNNVYYINTNNVTLTTGSGNDTFYITGNNNTISGNGGDDYFIVSGDNNTINGGDGKNYIVDNGHNPNIYDTVADPNSGAFVFTQANEVKVFNIGNKTYTITNINSENQSILNHEISYTHNKNTDKVIFNCSNVTINSSDEMDHNIRLNGSNNILNGGNKKDTIIISSGNNNIINGNDGNDNITLNSANNSINGGNGGDTINLNKTTDKLIDGGNNNDIININSDNNTNIKLGSGNDTVNGTTSNSNIYLENGNSTLLLKGNNNEASALDGNNRISFIGNDNNISTGIGNNTVGFKGNNNSAKLDGAGTFNIEGNNNTIENNGNIEYNINGDLNTIIALSGVSKGIISGNQNDISISTTKNKLEINGNSNIFDSSNGVDDISVKGNSNILIMNNNVDKVGIRGDLNYVEGSDDGLSVSIRGNNNETLGGLGDDMFKIFSGENNIIDGVSGKNLMTNYALNTISSNVIDVTPRPLEVNIQIGANASETLDFTLEFALADFELDYSSRESILQNVEKIDKLLEKVSNQMSMIGAKMNRLESINTLNELNIQNLTIKNSIITDADIAKEAANKVNAQILQQISTALLSQSNNQNRTLVQKLLGMNFGIN